MRENLDGTPRVILSGTPGRINGETSKGGTGGTPRQKFPVQLLVEFPVKLFEEFPMALLE